MWKKISSPVIKPLPLPTGLTLTLVLSAVSLDTKYLLEKVCNSVFTVSLFTEYLAEDSHNLLTLLLFLCTDPWEVYFKCDSGYFIYPVVFTNMKKNSRKLHELKTHLK